MSFILYSIGSGQDRVSPGSFPGNSYALMYPLSTRHTRPPARYYCHSLLQTNTYAMITEIFYPSLSHVSVHMEYNISIHELFVIV